MTRVLHMVAETGVLLTECSNPLLLLSQILSWCSGSGRVSIGGSATLMQAFMETLVVQVGAGVLAIRKAILLQLNRKAICPFHSIIIYTYQMHRG
ncbi:unnamed protein product [Trifolium pratense]|uniref:Uncharacterized protein n=1 Tax=Trifolium pratense TaxID=57577 RepID=A0ACB0LFX5_TRIPR|nr:unnamed protein product [Trifolium pratense]